MNPTAYRTLGRSGLVVSPLSLGTMTFGTAGWGTPDDGSAAIFNAYVDAGGNFVDTADVYSRGRSEELVGEFIAARKLRDRVVLATKFAWNVGDPAHPNAGGNGRKHIYTALEASLRRLKTDHVDLYWLHVHDLVTPIDEVLQTFGDLVRAGKIRYFGLSNIPAWYATRAATLAQAHAIPGPVALQLEYSLVSRSIEREFLPAARECGLGVCPWSPLAAGFLAGKYQREEGGTRGTGVGRLAGKNPFGDSKFTERNWQVLAALRGVADQLGRPLAQVALAWVAAQPGITAPIIGATKLDQLHDNLAALDIRFAPDQLQALDVASQPDPEYPYPIFSPAINQRVFGGATVQGWR